MSRDYMYVDNLGHILYGAMWVQRIPRKERTVVGRQPLDSDKLIRTYVCCYVYVYVHVHVRTCISWDYVDNIGHTMTYEASIQV